MEKPNGTLSRIECKGSVEVGIRDCHDAVRSYTFHNVLFVPSYNMNLMKVSSAVARGSSFNFTADSSHRLAPNWGGYLLSSAASFYSLSANSGGIQCV